MKIVLLLTFLISGCSSNKYMMTAGKIDLDKFMGKWHVLAGRLTSMEDGAHNAIEIYQWNEKEKQIDIQFQFNKDSFNGELEKIPQKGWIENQETKSHWLVSPFWPLKFDYLVLAVGEINQDLQYDWTAVGVPSGDYLWIMARDWKKSKTEINKMIDVVKKMNYPTENIIFVPNKF